MTESYYSDELVTLYHGRAEDILPTLANIDHVITDPPYSEHTHKSVRSAKMLANDRGGAVRVGHQTECRSGIRRAHPRAAVVLRSAVRPTLETVGSRVL